MGYDRIHDREETEAERLDRQLGELLQEVRVAVPGVQVLFAFLLTVPFAARFGETNSLQRYVYIATLLMTAVATALLMGPGAIHRVLFQRGQKDYIVRLAQWLTLLGFGVLAGAIGLAVFLVTDMVFTLTPAAIAAAAILAFTVGIWYLLPLTRRLRATERQPEE